MVTASSAALRDFRALYEAEYGFVWSAVRRLGVPGPVAEDAVQDTFIVAYRKRDSFEAGPPRPWLYGIARGVASNYRRSARRVARKHQALSSTVMTAERAGHPSPHASVLALERFLSGLSESDRELFVLSEIEGMTGPEVAASVQIQPRAIYRRLAKLRARFETQAIDDGALRPRRPRASAASWMALVPALRTASVGWMGLTAGAWKLAALVVGVSGVAGIGVLSATSRPSIARTVVAPVNVAASPAPAPNDPPPPRLASVATSPPAAPTPVRTVGRVVTAAPATTVDNSPAGSLAQENALLRRAAKAAADKNFAEALDATSQHATEFPRSPMTDLRQALRIESLCGLGKTQQARGEAHAFVAANPDAPMVERINRACVTQTAGSGQ